MSTNVAGIRTGRGTKRRRKFKPDNPSQSAKFIKAAKELWLEQSGEGFEKAMRKLLKPKSGSS